LPEGLPKVADLVQELDAYRDVLLGRVDPPVDAGVASLMECADAYFARACEIDMLIHQGEREFTIGKGDDHYKFRTGELRAFLDLTKRAAEMGSRRITLAQMQMNHGR
jgi:RNAse (barnase) inhibitor barstar